jgi:hypothetical protein
MLVTNQNENEAKNPQNARPARKPNNDFDKPSAGPKST